MHVRIELLHQIASAIRLLPGRSVVRVAIDGVDGAGKTTFADELAHTLDSLGAPTIRASVDSFHNARSVRYRLGKSSPRGFFQDSYNYELLKAVLLDPLSPNGSGRYRKEAFNHQLDLFVDAPEEQAKPGSILVFDGIFLHRPELRAYWDFSIFLEVGFDVSIPRGAQRDNGPSDPNAEENRRYVGGQKIYLDECNPKSLATMIVNNENLAAPRVIVL